VRWERPTPGTEYHHSVAVARPCNELSRGRDLFAVRPPTQVAGSKIRWILRYGEDLMLFHSSLFDFYFYRATA